MSRRRKVVLLVSVACIVWVILACGASQSQLLRRASFDLQCPENQIQLHQIDQRTVGVRGCGQQGTYVESCADANRTNCTWVLNSPAAPAP